MCQFREINAFCLDFFHAIKEDKLWMFTLWKLRNFTATIVTEKFRQINVLLKNFTISWFDGKIFAFFLTVENLLWLFFDKNFVKLMFYYKLIWRKKICVAVNLSFFHNVCQTSTFFYQRNSKNILTENIDLSVSYSSKI